MGASIILIISDSVTTRNNLTTMLRNLGFDDVISLSTTSAKKQTWTSGNRPAVVLLDGHPSAKVTIRQILTGLFATPNNPIPVILLLTSRELKGEFLADFNPYITSVMFKPVSPRLLEQHLHRFFNS